MPEDEAREPLPKSLTRYTGFLVGKAHQNLWHHFTASCRAHGLEIPHAIILHLLEERGAMSRQQLVLSLRIDRPNIIKFVDTMDKLGVATLREHPEDRRAHLVQITAAGRQVIKDIQKEADAMEAGLLAGFTAEERQVIRRALLVLAG